MPIADQTHGGGDGLGFLTIGGIDNAIEDIVQRAALGDHLQDFGADLLAIFHLLADGDVAGGGVDFATVSEPGCITRRQVDSSQTIFAVGAAEAEFDLAGFARFRGLCRNMHRPPRGLRDVRNSAEFCAQQLFGRIAENGHGSGRGVKESTVEIAWREITSEEFSARRRNSPRFLESVLGQEIHQTLGVQ